MANGPSSTASFNAGAGMVYGIGTLPDCNPSKIRKARWLGNPFYRWLRGACAPARGRAKKSTLEIEALGRYRGGLTTNIHMRVDGKGQIMTFLLMPGQIHEISRAEKLMERGEVRRC